MVLELSPVRELNVKPLFIDNEILLCYNNIYCIKNGVLYELLNFFSEFCNRKVKNMKVSIPVEKNKDYEIYIDGFGYEGEGVGKIDNFTVFVKDALKGEKVKAKIVKINKNFAFGKLLEVLEASKDRVKPICPSYKRCGGCRLQHLSYEGQLDFKKDRVKDSFEKIAKIKVGEEDAGVKLYDTIGMETPYYYRNKVQLPVGEKDGQILIGFYAERSHDIIDTNKCYIQDESANKVIEVMRSWIKAYNIKPYDEESGRGLLRHIMVRKGFKTNEVMVVLVTANRNLPHTEELISTLTENIEGIVSIIQNINSKKTNVVLGDKLITLWGKATIQDYIGQFKFNISPKSFFQVNPVQTEKLYSKVLEYAGLTGSETVFDAYCGTGTISLFLSQKAKKVYGVEIIPEAIDNAKENAIENGVENAEFIVGKSEEEIPRLINRGIRPEVVVVDPPRKGCEKVLLESIAKAAPRTIVYVSCDPGTLARDLGILKELGYKAEKAQPVDMFPETAHVETVVGLCRVDS